MKPKTYILKREVHNDETFPVGTIIKEYNGVMNNFEVVGGKMKGKRGGVADKLSRGFVCDNTKENRALIKSIISMDKRLKKHINDNYRLLSRIPTSKGLKNYEI